MSHLWTVDPVISLSGFLIGLLVGQTGMGGGALMTPLLVLLFGVHPATAVGIDLLYASATKSVGTLVHGLGLYSQLADRWLSGNWQRTGNRSNLAGHLTH